MRIIVCIKQVPEISDVKMDPKTGTLIREGVKSITNPFDEYAIEEALLWKEKYGGEVIVISMGPPQAMAVLKDAIARGANKAYLISDRAFGGADTLATAYTLSKVIEMLGGVDLIFCGKQAIDGDTGQVGPGIACRLNFSLLTYVSKIKEINVDAKKIVVERFLENGRQIIETSLPCVVSVLKGINEPRLPSIRGIRQAAKTEIPALKADDIPGLDKNKLGLNGSPTKVLRIFSPEPRQKGEVLKGETGEVVRILTDKLLKANVIKT